MTYDIAFSPGEPSAASPLDPEDLEELPPLALTGSEQRSWERALRRFEDEIGPVEIQAYPTHVDVCHDEPRVRLEYYGRSACLSLPYWYAGEAATAALALAYALGRIIEQETGLVGVDCQTGSGLSDHSLAQALVRYGGAVNWVREEFGQSPRG
jgi:hypothetical protein